MINLKYIDVDASSFYQSIIDSKYNTKDNLEYKARLDLMTASVFEQYKKYENWFSSKCLFNATAHGFAHTQALDLRKMYDYRSKAMKKLMLDLTTDTKNRIFNTCQNCTINEIDSFDHILPQGEFSEFSVHPRNLFPSCSYCNRLKSSVWRDNNRTLFLNLYLDQLPVEQYLFVDIRKNRFDYEVTFKLENKFYIESNLSFIIETHYERLKLLYRFRINCSDIVSEFKCLIETYKPFMSKTIAKTVIVNKIASEKARLGQNNWKLVLESALVNSNDFFDYLYDS